MDPVYTTPLHGPAKISATNTSGATQAITPLAVPTNKSKEAAHAAKGVGQRLSKPNARVNQMNSQGSSNWKSTLSCLSFSSGSPWHWVLIVSDPLPWLHVLHLCLWCKNIGKPPEKYVNQSIIKPTISCPWSQ